MINWDYGDGTKLRDKGFEAVEDINKYFREHETARRIAITANSLYFDLNMPIIFFFWFLKSNNLRLPLVGVIFMWIRVAV